MKIFALFLMFALGCTHLNKVQKPSWTQQSDRMAEEFTKAMAQNHPEVGSELGYNEFDRQGLVFDIHTEEKDRRLFVEWMDRLNTEKSKISDIELKTDYEVLQNWVQNRINHIDIYRKAREVEFTPGVQFVYENLQILLNSQSPTQRKNAAIDRFKVYVRGDLEHRPLLVAFTEVFQFQLLKYKDKNALLPYRGEVEQYLKDSDALLSGIEELLETSGRSDWREDWEQFKKQATAYNSFVKNVVLINSRKDPRVPIAVYAQILKHRGIESTPEQLIQTGLSDYKKIYKQFQAQAVVVAKKYHLPKSDPATVIKYLKSKPVTQAHEVEQLYKTADQRLDKIMKDHQLISMPKTPLRIRVAGDAESRTVLVPQLKQPPLINNKGERPEFIVPSSDKGLPFDDFSSPHSAMILTAHEGRPGHDMQFSQMLDNGLSVIRSRYAANNVNIEGWALYAEDLVFPYLNTEEQLFALQTRLWRVARMFLDPQLQLGKIPDQRIIDVFTKELGVSEAMANLELRRYKYNDIGQAPSYYEGYLLVKKMRDEVKEKLREKFNLKCFNDQLLSYGLLPLKISASRIESDLNCD